MDLEPNFIDFILEIYEEQYQSLPLNELPIATDIYDEFYNEVIDSIADDVEDIFGDEVNDSRLEVAGFNMNNIPKIGQVILVLKIYNLPYHATYEDKLNGVFYNSHQLLLFI